MKPLKISFLLGLVASLIGLTVMLGWFFHLPFLIKIHPTLNSMKFNTALCFFLTGLAVVFYVSRLKVISQSFGGIVFVISVLQLLQYITGMNFGIDQFFYKDYLTDPLQFPGRMAPQTALCYMMAGIGLWIELVTQNKFVIFYRNFCGALLAVIGLTAIFGFIFHIPFAFTWGSYNALALHTALGFVLLGIAFIVMSLHKYYTPLLITLLVGSTLALQVYYGAYNIEKTSLEAHFATDSKDRIQAIQKEFLINHYIVRSLSAFYESSQFVSRQEFDKFAKGVLRSSEGHIEALEWIPKIPKEQLNVFVDQAKADGIDLVVHDLTTDQQIITLTDRDAYYPVFYKYPQESSDQILGVDFSTNAKRWLTMKKACESATFTATAPLNLIKGQTASSYSRGYLLFYPLYENQPEGAAVFSCASLKGFTVGVFQIKNIIEKALEPLQDIGINVYIYHLAEENNKELFYSHLSSQSSSQDPRDLSYVAFEHANSLKYSHNFTHAGQNFAISTVATLAYVMRNQSVIPYVLLVLILLSTVVIAFYIFSQIRRAEVVEILVEERTGQLLLATQAAIASENRQAIQFEVAQIVAGASTFNESMAKILEAVCLRLNYSWGALWVMDSRSKVLRFSQNWKSTDIDFAEFEKISQALTFLPGIGLPGRVWEDNKPAWIADVVKDPNFPRASVAERVGMHSAIAFPIRVENKVIAVVEFISRKIKNPDEKLLAVLDIIGSQIGQYISRKEAEQEMIETAKIKSEFASTVSHELRTPLTVIKGGIDLIADEVVGPTNKDQKDVIVSVKNNVDRLSRLINDVLDYQKLESKRMTFKMERQDLNSIILTLIKEFSLQAQKRGLELVSEMPGEATNVSGDKDKLIQVMYNLLNNALKFMTQGIIKVTMVKTADGFVKVSVIDQGPGIKEEDKSKLFQSFSQLESLEERKSGGTGLGLSISKKIIEAHGGTIGVESVFGQGATFYFTLKLV